MFEFIGNHVLKAYTYVIEIPKRAKEKRLAEEAERDRIFEESQKRVEENRILFEKKRLENIQLSQKLANLKAEQQMKEAFERREIHKELEKRKIQEFLEQKEIDKKSELYAIARQYQHSNISEDSCVSFQGVNYNLKQLLNEINGLKNKRHNW